MAETSGEHHQQGEQTNLPDNSVLVGSGKPSNFDALLQKQTDRRGFLSLFAKGAGVAIAAAAIPKSVVEAAKTPSVQFQEVGPDAKLSLATGASSFGTEYVIHLFGAKTKLQMRLDANKTMVGKQFVDGMENERKFGEIVDPRVTKLTRNSELGNEINIGMYYKAAGNQDVSNFSRENLSEENCWGIPVITELRDYMKNGVLPPQEQYKKETYGIGWAVGSMRETNGQKIFNLKGFVLDSRALVPAAV